MKLTRTQRACAVPLGVLCGTFGNRALATQCFRAAASGHWEGTDRNRYRNRPGVRLESQDQALNYGARDAYINEARALEQTYDIVGSITRKYANHVVGDCRVTWNTGDDATNKLYAANWERWMNIADFDGKWRFPKLTKIAVETTLREGDVFGQFIGESDARGEPIGSGRIRIIEPDRVRNSASMMDVDEPPRIVGGINFSPAGQPVSYRVWQRTQWGLTFENPQNIPAFQMRHMMDSTRADAKRGVTAFKAVIDHMRDEKEIVEAEKLAVKRNSKLALIVKTVLGGAAAPQVNLFSNDDGTTGTSDGEGGRVNVQEVNNAVDAYMHTSEDAKAHESDRPSQGWFELMRWLIHHTANGLHLPFGVVWTMAGLSGPGVRFELGQANRTFSAFRTDVVEAQWIVPFVALVTARDMRRKAIPYHPNWFMFAPRRPSSITIDIGREGKLGLDEIDACAGSITDYLGEEGKEFEEVTDRRAYEEYAIQKAAAFWSRDGITVDPNRLRRPPQTAATIETAASAAEAKPAEAV